jgi:hypothetical protein
MQAEIASRTILARLKSMSGEDQPAVSLSQIRMWVLPQKGEQDYDYSINPSYFDAMLMQAMRDLLAAGYVASSVRDGIDDGDARVFSLTFKGARYVEELAAASVGL